MTALMLERVLIPERDYNRKGLYQPGAEPDRGEYAVSLSPFNMPSVMEVQFVPKADVLIASFHYPNHEPYDKEISHGVVTLKLGRNSKKVLELQVAGARKAVENEAPVQIPSELLDRIKEDVTDTQQFVFERTARIANTLLKEIWDDLRSAALKAAGQAGE